MTKPAQRRRARFGETALDQGQVTVEALEDCLGLQALRAREGAEVKIGEVMIERGYLTTVQVEVLLRIQDGAKLRMEVGGYEILSKIGSGGMGSVYKARDLTAGRLVALKILPPRSAADAAVLERFRRESRTAMMLDHPHIIKGIAAGEDQGFYYFAMEYVRGHSLMRLVRKDGPLGERLALDLTRQVASALDHAARFGVLHRDIKPDNILLRGDHFVKVTDFGLSRLVSGEDTLLTLPGVAIGTPYYMSPEQTRGEIDLDSRSDLYSLGATLYEMLTGDPPYSGPSVAMILSRHLTEPPTSPRQARPDLADGTCALVLRLLAKDREDRHAGPAELLADLDGLLEHLGQGEAG